MGWSRGERALLAAVGQAAGLIVPNSSVQHFGDEIAIWWSVMTGCGAAGGGRVSTKRICVRRSAFIPPASMRAMAGQEAHDCRAIEGAVEQSAEDVQSFVDANIFNWLIAGPMLMQRTMLCF